MNDKYIVDALQHAFENVSGKTFPADSYGNIVDMLNAFNTKYECVVTFVPPEDKTIKKVYVVDTAKKKIPANADGTYSLRAGSYTYGGTVALGNSLTTIMDKTLTISDTDVTTGTKSVTLEP